jgi:hypothetical protein
MDETTSIASFDFENSDISVYPNPFSNSITFEYELNQAAEVKIIIYNQLGNQVDVLMEKQYQGANKITWKPAAIPEGIYYYKIMSGKQKTSGKVVLMR